MCAEILALQYNYLGRWFSIHRHAFQFHFAILGRLQFGTLNDARFFWRYQYHQSSVLRSNTGLAVRPRRYLALVLGIVVQHDRLDSQTEITCAENENNSNVAYTRVSIIRAYFTEEAL